MLRFPLAKINIGLHILGKRPDGYHDLETVFYPIRLCDALEIIPSDELKMHTWGDKWTSDTEYPMENICVKAYKLLQTHYEIAPIAIHLLKKIPVGAGLGGGSSDGACMLNMLNELYNLNLDAETLRSFALSLGSDCPFFIEGKPVFATGRGELLSPLDLDLSAYFIVLIKPPFSISTKEAFSSVQVRTSVLPLSRRPLLPLSVAIKDHPASWKDVCMNDFEHSLFSIYPSLRLIKERLYECGAIFASLSGSGSALYGIFEDEPDSIHFEQLGEVFVRKL